MILELCSMLTKGALVSCRGANEFYSQIMYGHLYPNNGTKITARTTTQDRMLKSAEYFMAGFFGLQWTQNASLVVVSFLISNQTLMQEQNH